MPATILVVDDNELVRDVVQKMLNAAGYQAMAAESGSTALALQARQTIDAAIVDFDMPEMNGVEVCAALRAQAAANGMELAVWIMTGGDHPDLAAAAQGAGARGVLAKPFLAAELIACFARLSTGGAEHALAS